MATSPVVTNVPESEATRKLREAQERKTQKETGSPPDPQPVPEPQIVEKIVEKEVYPSDVKAVIEKARQEEKDKLYDRIRRAESVESENAALKKSISKIEKEHTDLLAQLEEQKKGGKKKSGDGELETQVIIDETAKLVAQQMAANFKTERDAFQSEIEGLKTALKKRDLGVLRDRLVAEAGGKIIPELVRGDTEEDLRTSVIEAKKAFERIATQVGGISKTITAPTTATAPSANVPAANATTQPAAPPVVEPGPTATSDVGDAFTDESEKFGKGVRSMSREEYAKVRKSVLGKVKQMFKPDENVFIGR